MAENIQIDDPEVTKLLRDAARRTGQSVTEVLKDAVRAYAPDQHEKKAAERPDAQKLLEADWKNLIANPGSIEDLYDHGGLPR